MDEAPRTKAALLGRVRAASAALDDVIAQVPRERLEERGAVGDWSVRDVIAHISADESWMVAQLRALARNEPPAALDAYGTDVPPPAGLDLGTQDGRNAWQYQRLRHLPLEEVLARSTRSRATVIAMIESMPEGEFGALYALEPNRFVGRIRPAASDREPLSSPLWRWLAGNTWHHYEDHAAGLRPFAEAT